MVGKKARWTRAAKVAAKKERKERAARQDDWTEEKEEFSTVRFPQQLSVDNKLFEEYYVEQGIISKDDAEKFMDYMKKSLPISFRISADRRGVQEFVRVLRQDYFSKFAHLSPEDGLLQSPEPIPWFPDESAWQLTLDWSAENELLHDFTKFLYQEAECGNVIQQDVAGMLPTLLLDIKPHHRVLDLRASPGHRTTHLIDILHSDENVPNPGGVVIANETHLKRCFFLNDQIRRSFSQNFAIVNMDANNLPSLYLSESSDSDPFLYDRIICGFPSSGDGMFRNNLDGLRCWTPNIPLSHHGHLVQMLYSGLSSLAIDGRLVFSTYSMNPVEAEAVVYAVIMQQRGTVELEDVSKQMPDLVYEKGLHSWKVMVKGPRWFRDFEEVPEHFHAQITHSVFPPAREEAERVGLEKCVRILPHKEDTLGLFVAVFRRTSSLYDAWKHEQEEQQRAYEAAIEEAKRLEEAKEREAKTKLEEEERKKLEKVEIEKTKSDNEVTPTTVEEEQKSNDVVATDEQQQQQQQQDSSKKSDDSGKTEKTTEKEAENVMETRDEVVIPEKAEMEKMEEEKINGADKFGEASSSVGEDKTDLEEQTAKEEEEEEIEKESHDDEIVDNAMMDQSTSENNYYGYWNQSSYQEDEQTGKTEIDEKKSRIDGMFIFLKAEDKFWLEIKEFYGICDDFPVSRLTCRAVSGLKQHLCLVTETIKTLIEVNQKIYSFVSVGVPIFTFVRRVGVNCSYRLTQEGLPVILPFMTKRIISVTRTEFLAILDSPCPALDGLTEKTRQKVTSLESGGFVLVLGSEPQVGNTSECQLAISALKEASSFRTFIPAYLRLHFLRFVGADMENYEEKCDIEQYQSAAEIIARNFPL